MWVPMVKTPTPQAVPNLDPDDFAASPPKLVAMTLTGSATT